MPALVFDCDGVLADTERDGHRVAFNEMFRELGLPIEWSVEEYARKLQVAGGKERMATERGREASIRAILALVSSHPTARIGDLVRQVEAELGEPETEKR